MSEINVTPFVDVMLVLLIIFMVTAPLLTVGVQVDLPESSADSLPEEQEPLTLSINSKGEIFIQESKVEYNKIIDIEIDKNRLLGVDYSYASYKTNFGETKLHNLLGKVIFIVNNNINIYESTELYEYVNASSKSEYMRFMRVKDLNNFDSQNVQDV